jgi:hypothetical protein
MSSKQTTPVSNNIIRNKSPSSLISVGKSPSKINNPTDIIPDEMKHVISSSLKEQQHKENKYYKEISTSNNIINEENQIDTIKYNNTGSSSLDTSLTRQQQQEQNDKLSIENNNIKSRLNNNINNIKTSSSHDMNNSGVRISGSDCSYSESNFESEGIYY